MYRALKATNKKLGGILVAFLTQCNKRETFAGKVNRLMDILLGFQKRLRDTKVKAQIRLDTLF